GSLASAQARPVLAAGRSSAARGGTGLLVVVQHLVVVVLGHAQVDPEPVAQPEQQLELIPVLAAAQDGVDAGRGPVEGGGEVALLDEEFCDQVAGTGQGARARVAHLAEQGVGLLVAAQGEHRPGQPDPRVGGVGPASSHCYPARICASAREMPLGVAWAWAARRLIRTAARLWLPVRAALTSIASNKSPDNTTTLSTLPTAAMDNPGVDSFYRRLPS